MKRNDLNIQAGVTQMKDENGTVFYTLGKAPSSQTIGGVLGDKLKEIFNKIEIPEKEKEDPVVFFYKKFMEVNENNFVCVIPFDQWFSFVKIAHDLLPIEERPVLFYIKGFGVSLGMNDIYKIFEKRVINLYGKERAEQLKEEITTSNSSNYESFVSLRLKSSSEKENGKRIIDHPSFEKKGRETFLETCVYINPVVNMNLKLGF